MYLQEELLADYRTNIDEMTEEMKSTSSHSMEEMLESLRQEQSGRFPYQHQGRRLSLNEQCTEYCTMIMKIVFCIIISAVQSGDNRPAPLILKCAMRGDNFYYYYCVIQKVDWQLLCDYVTHLQLNNNGFFLSTFQTSFFSSK